MAGAAEPAPLSRRVCCARGSSRYAALFRGLSTTSADPIVSLAPWPRPVPCGDVSRRRRGASGRCHLVLSSAYDAIVTGVQSFGTVGERAKTPLERIHGWPECRGRPVGTPRCLGRRPCLRRRPGLGRRRPRRMPGRCGGRTREHRVGGGAQVAQPWEGPPRSRGHEALAARVRAQESRPAGAMLKSAQDRLDVVRARARGRLCGRACERPGLPRGPAGPPRTKAARSVPIRKISAPTGRSCPGGSACWSRPWRPRHRQRPPWKRPRRCSL